MYTTSPRDFASVETTDLGRFGVHYIAVDLQDEAWISEGMEWLGRYLEAWAKWTEYLNGR